MAVSPANLQVLQQALALAGVGSLSFSPIEQDEATGLYVRTLRVFGEAPAGQTGDLVLSIKLSGASERAIQFTTPSISV